MLLDYKNKKKIVEKLKNIFNISLSLVLIDFKNVSSNEMNIFRKKIRDNESFLIVTRNSLFKLAVKDTKFDMLSVFFIGPTAVGCSLKKVNSVSNILFSLKKKNKLCIKSVFIENKIISLDLNKKLSKFSSRKEALFYFIFFIKDLFIFKFLRLLNNIKNIK